MDLSQTKESILQKVAIDKLISEFVGLKKRGTNWTGLCPFHGEKSPSFYVYSDHFYCFGCKAHGDVISFWQQKQNVGFVDAVKQLAAKYGIPLPEEQVSRATLERRRLFQQSYRTMTLSQDLFTRELGLKSTRAGLAKRYLESRGLTSEDIANYGFGLTPESPWGLTQYLTKVCSIPSEELVQLSLALKSERNPGHCYDFFQNRLMLPIHDPLGKLIGFGGRTLDPNVQPKYKNSGATPLFDKSTVLYGLHRAREAIKTQKEVFLVEGYFDAIQFQRGGVLPTVASMGTSLSSQHLTVLRSVSSQAAITVVYDGDAAGKKASLAMAALTLDWPQFDFYVVILPDNFDPDTFMLKHGKDGVEKLLSQRVNLLNFAIKSKLAPLTTDKYPAFIRSEVFPWIVKITDPLKADFLLTKLSEYSGLSLETLKRELRAQQPRPSWQGYKEAVVQPLTLGSQEEVSPSLPVLWQRLGKIEKEAIALALSADPNLKEDVALLMSFFRSKINLPASWQEVIQLTLAKQHLEHLTSEDRQFVQNLTLHVSKLKENVSLARQVERLELGLRKDYLKKQLESLKKMLPREEVSPLAKKDERALSIMEEYKKITQEIRLVDRSLHASINNL